MNNFKHKCPTEVVWNQIILCRKSFMISIEVSNSNLIIIPDHLKEPNIKQYEVKIICDKSVDEKLVKEYLENTFSCESFVYCEDALVCYAGSVFKRPNYQGYYTLKIPCLICSMHIQKKYYSDNEKLQKIGLQCRPFDSNTIMTLIRF